MLTNFARHLCAALALSTAPFALAQQAGMPPASSAPTANAPAQQPAKRKAPQPARDAQPGGGPDKVWVNLNSSTYHCYGDRYYGKTANGHYMTEAAARSAGAKGAGGKTCSTSK